MGSSVGGSRRGGRGPSHGAGKLELGTIHLAHQSVGVSGSSARSEEVPASGSRADCLDQNGQFNDVCLHKQTRRHTFVQPLLAGMAPVAVVHSAPDRVEGDPCAGSRQCPGRLSFEAEDRPERMVSSSEGGKHDLRQVGQTQHRSVCVNSQSQTDSVLFTPPLSGSSEQGRILHLLEQLSKRICVPSHCATGQGPQEGSHGSGQSNTGSPVLAKQMLVSGYSSGSSGCSSDDIPLARLAVAVSGKSPGPQPFQTGGVEDKRRFLREQGFSEEVINTIQGARAQSTVAVYAGKWDGFVSWCNRRRMDPHSTTVAQICLYLQPFGPVCLYSLGTIDWICQLRKA